MTFPNQSGLPEPLNVLATNPAGQITAGVTPAGVLFAASIQPGSVPGPSDWLNVKTQYGAKGDGSADDTTAIQNALNAASPGQVVYLPQGTYKVTAPLTVPNGAVLAGPSRSFGVPTGNYGSGGLPLAGAVIQPSALFSGAAVIGLGNAPASQAGGQSIYRVTVDGSQLPSSANVAGIQAIGWVAGVTLREVLIWSGFSFGQMLGPGIDAHADGSGHAPDFWDMAFCKVSGINGTGVNFAGLSDSYVLNCESTGNGGDNWKITNCNNTRFAGCKGEASNTGLGWNLTGQGGYAGTAYFTGCTSGGNGGGGWAVSGTGTGTYRLNGINATDTTPYTFSGSNTTAFAPVDAPGTYSPADLGFVAWAYDPALIAALNTVLSSGVPFLIGMQVKRPATVTGIRVFVTTGGSGLTSGQCFAGLHRSDGTVIGSTADQSTAWATGGSNVDMPLTGGPYMVTPGLYWVQVLANGATPPALGRVAAENATLANGRNGAATARFATNGTGKTSIAAITPSSNSLAVPAIWAAIY